LEIALAGEIGGGGVTLQPNTLSGVDQNPPDNFRCRGVKQGFNLVFEPVQFVAAGSNRLPA